MNESDALAKILWFYNIPIEGSKMKILCPFHSDENPSLLVNLEQGKWYCFGCGRSGNAETFVKYMNPKANTLQVCKIYTRILRSKKVSEVKASKIACSKPRKAHKQLYDEAYDYYHGLSKVNWLSPGDSDDILSALTYMQERGFEPETLMKCKAKITYNKSYGLIFPMLDNGKFRGWVCRTMLKEIEKKRKYLYNEGFSRATTLVGNYGEHNFVFVVEGYMDMLKFLQYGIDNVVAILGWKMSIQQEEKLKKAGIKYIISALDNDECGKKGTKYLISRFKTIRFSYLKGIKDPGEMTKESFKKMYRKTMQTFKEEVRNGFN